MIAALIVVVSPAIVVLFYTGMWMGFGRQVLFLGLAGALVTRGAKWARWGLALWFGLMGVVFILAGLVASALATQPATATVAPQVLLGVLYLMFAAIFALGFGIRGWLEFRWQGAAETPGGGPGPRVG